MKNKKTPAASRLELKRQTVRNFTISTGIRTGYLVGIGDCDAGCSNPGSGCTNNSGKGIILLPRK